MDDEPMENRVAFNLEPAIGYPLTLHLAPWQSATPFSWVSRLASESVASGDFLARPGVDWKILLATHGDQLMSGMPESVRSVIRLAPFLGVELAQVCGRLKTARELAASSPLLLILLTDRGVEEEWTLESFSHLLDQKQTTLCTEVGLPGMNSHAKLLRRCLLRPMIRRELMELKRTMCRPDDVVLLRHHTSTRLDHISFMAWYEGTRWPGLLGLVDDTLENQRPRPGAIVWLKGLITDVERLLAGNTQSLRRVTRIDELQALHDRQVQRFNAQITSDGGAKSAEDLQQQHGDYPPPPLPGNDAITPVGSWNALLQEGKRMQHCVGSYHRAVAGGQVAIYHMHKPEEVTVAITRKGGKWSLSEAKGHGNTTPSAEAYIQIQGWMKGSTKL
ncbi:MAG: PcfJ domain-containing protein [Pseudomonadota bacterium]